jgi:hypothetical protein
LSLAPAGRPPLLFAAGSVLASSCGSATGVIEGVFSTTSTSVSSIFEILQGFEDNSRTTDEQPTNNLKTS